MINVKKKAAPPQHSSRMSRALGSYLRSMYVKDTPNFKPVTFGEQKYASARSR